jgi:methyl-accepting chemotaxis protein
MEISHEGMIRDLGIDETALTEAEKGLVERPTMSIRAKITLGFILLFALCALASITFWVMGSRINQKLIFTETINHYAFEIQQARRFEKNYFLYGTNLADALNHAQSANTFLQTEALNLQTVVGKEKLNNLANHVGKYITLLENLQLGEQQSPGAASPQRHVFEADLRMHGSEMVSLALNMVQKERQSVEEMLRWARRVPVYFLIFLFFLMFYLAHLLSRQILGPLTQLLRYTQRIANGDFTPVLPSRPYRDEFSALREAMNRMLESLT